jgi:hypothetical protein
MSVHTVHHDARSDWLDHAAVLHRWRPAPADDREPAAHHAAPSELPNIWRKRAALFRLYGAEAPAATLEAMAVELENAWVATVQELLPLTTAAAESGYSTSQLRRMIREGKVPNAGAHGAPLIRRADLPRKPRRPVDSRSLPEVSSKRQIARAVAAGR